MLKETWWMKLKSKNGRASGFMCKFCHFEVQEFEMGTAVSCDTMGYPYCPICGKYMVKEKEVK